MINFDRTLYQQKIKYYQRNYNLYTQLRDNLIRILEYLAGEISTKYIVHAHVKTLIEIGDTLIKNMTQDQHALNNMTDICVIEVILPNLEDLKAVMELIQANLFILSGGSQDIHNPKSAIVEYGPVRYVVQLHENNGLYEKLGIIINPSLRELKAEIHIQTMLQHAEVLNLSDIFNMGNIKIPAPYLRTLNHIATLIETTDKSLTNLRQNLQEYASSYGSYMTHEEIAVEMERLEILLTTDKFNFPIAQKYAKLAIITENWEKAEKILEEILKGSDVPKISRIKHAAILRDLGMVMCKIYKTSAPEYKKGQEYLDEAIKLNPQDSDAYAALGGTYKNLQDEEKASTCYKQALEVNPGDPYPLGNYLIYEIKRTGNLNPVKNHENMIRTAINRRQHHIELFVDMPWAFYDIGMFSLLQGDFYASITNYLLGIRFSPQIWMIETCLKTLDNLMPVSDQLEGFQIIRQALLLGIVFHPKKNLLTNEDINEKILPQLQQTLKQNTELSSNNLVILAGASDTQFDKILATFRNAFLEGFRDYRGILISGGTKLGVGNLGGEISERYSGNIRGIGYLPKNYPPGMNIDERYSDIRLTGGINFSILEAIQYWYDIFRSKINPISVKLIGVGGGQIAALEFRMAIVFGAQVGILQGSSRATTELINDPLWQEFSIKTMGAPLTRTFKLLKNTPASIHEFLTKPFIVDPDIENIQRVIFRESSGRDIFEMSINSGDLERDAIAGLTSALDPTGDKLHTTNFNDGYVLGGYILDHMFKIIFFLHETPSQSLDEKIEAFIRSVEEDLKVDLFAAQRASGVYSYSPKLERIFVNIFGSEILKLISKQ